MWETLNSAFVLWILSSVVLAGFSTALTGWHATRKAAAAEELRIRSSIAALDIEIEMGYRQLLCMSGVHDQAATFSGLSLAPSAN